MEALSSEATLYKRAYQLSLFTIGYNLIEGVVSMLLGYKDETLSLFGFGADSFIEMISGLGILQMVLRIRRNPGSPIGRFEIRAMQITGTGFFLLAAGLIAGCVLNIIQFHKPESTLWGSIISSISILVMAWLFYSKRQVGHKLNSEPILADARCTLVCIYMSVVLLLASALYELTGFLWADTIGAAGLAWFSAKEGWESFKKAKTKSYCE